MTTTLQEKPNAAKSLEKSVARGNYQVTAIRTLAEFNALKPEWDSFIQQADARNLCLTHGWLSMWLKQFTPESLLVLVVRDDSGQWVGVAPFKISKGAHGFAHRALRHLQFIGSHPNVYDWMKLVILPDVDESAVIRCMGQAIRKARWDVLDLMFAKDEHQLAQLLDAVQINPSRSKLWTSTTIPFLALPETVEAYEPTRRKKTRLEVNRHSNRFAKEFGKPPVLEFQPATEATDAILTRFFSGHIKYWADRGQKSDFQRYPGLQHFYKDMLHYSANHAAADEPKLQFSVLKMEEYQLSYHLGFWQGDGYLCHITNFNQGFKGYSPGTIHMDRLIFETLHRSGRLFEFGRGDEPYKRLWAKDSYPLWNLRGFRNPFVELLWQVDITLKQLMRKPVE